MLGSTRALQTSLQRWPSLAGASLASAHSPAGGPPGSAPCQAPPDRRESLDHRPPLPQVSAWRGVNPVAGGFGEEVSIPLIAGWQLDADPLYSALSRGPCSQEDVFWVPDTLRLRLGEDLGDCLHMG